jgi:hypothetical protein
MGPSTVYSWKKHWEEDEDWRPWDTGVHGIHLREFTDDEEKEITDIITSEYVEKGSCLQRQHFEHW